MEHAYNTLFGIHIRMHKIVNEYVGVYIVRTNKSTIKNYKGCKHVVYTKWSRDVSVMCANEKEVKLYM